MHVRRKCFPAGNALPPGGCCCTRGRRVAAHVLPQCSIASSMERFRHRFAKPRPAPAIIAGAGGPRFDTRRGHRGTASARFSGIGRRLARACTTRRTSTTPAAWASSPTSRAARATPSSRRASRSSKNLTHRGATGADPLQGDGAGILIQIPDAFLRRACGKLGHHAAGDRPVRRRHGVPAAGAGVAHGLRAGDRARDRGRGPGAARLARRADRQQRAVRSARRRSSR